MNTETLSPIAKHKLYVVQLHSISLLSCAEISTLAAQGVGLTLHPTPGHVTVSWHGRLLADVPAEWLHNDDDLTWPEMVAAPLDATEIPDTLPDHWDV